MRELTLITTGGTIEKTYDEHSGDLSNRGSIVRRMLQDLRLEETRVKVLELMSKDSLEMTEEDRSRIAEGVRGIGATREHPEPAALLAGEAPCQGVVILHGTDTLCETGEVLHRALAAELTIPVILTGAMRPFEMRRSDALQNLTESLFATGVLAPGVYVVAHGRALRFPGVVKDREHGTFKRRPGASEESADQARPERDVTLAAG